MKKMRIRYKMAGTALFVLLSLTLIHELRGTLLVIGAVWPRSGMMQNLGENFTDVVTSPFGARLDSNGNYDFHEGIDMRAAPSAAFPFAVSF